MRVAIVTPRFPPDPGGVEQYAAWVARTVRDAGHDVLVVTTGRGRRLVRTSYDGIPVVRLGTWLTLSNTPVNPLWAWQLRRLLRGADVVNAHAPVPGLADLTALVATQPVVLTYHSGSLAKGGVVDPLLRAYERHALPRVFRRCAALVAVSPVSLAHATGRATLIPPGVDGAVFASTGEPRGRTVLYAGRVERTSRWKGLQVLVDALPRLRALVPDVRLEVVGDGDDVETLQKRAAELGVADLVAWHGRVAHHELPAYYRRAGVTVLPSLTESESFGMTLAEALACGCPVVGSDVGGIPFVVRDGVDGRLVPPGDPAALADALAGALTSPMAVEPSRWDWEQRVGPTLSVLEAVWEDVA
ncbi:glycosyltransferase family 4 protein [Nocardioides sp. URHA0032]|uniref:glycosyltransferase family 4 protein n=1 Tax=Nocardioides sp. URHA0032 TaxID=1380388 RepID=UPI00048AB7B5|nr:glycosyltransferase family 4 protein [Nocardioides sp. URHA0032]